MIKSKSFLIITFFAILCFSCKKQVVADAAVNLITVEEMDSLLDMGKVQLIDVRTPDEYSDGHIEGALNIDFRNENFEELISRVDKSKPVAVYCGRGGRSGKCSAYMQKAGFTKIYDLDGGITEWKFKGKKVVR
ncbi:rhodanese-like domain-containing protein [Aquimarina sp. 2201CG5-10]|uniref:rhodanese-like domain-containing protein n=1 Tax=Aquimarina callyspongiae TaxID=3098150 RepID=UPI002AB39E05|nr:rhodanese-like domain-containing protein [Aquimarina sp. 2201CG5-10]MDY8134181.1 rhodanese-like domain-containing protein [Aquimarina sp. 2201CG5-10]